MGPHQPHEGVYWLNPFYEASFTELTVKQKKKQTNKQTK